MMRGRRSSSRRLVVRGGAKLNGVGRVESRCGPGDNHGVGGVAV